MSKRLKDKRRLDRKLATYSSGGANGQAVSGYVEVEELDVPDSVVTNGQADEPEQLAEHDDDYVYVPWGVTSFADLKASQTAREAADEVLQRADQLKQLISNVMGSDVVPDKRAAIRTLIDEFGELTDGLLAGATDENAEAAMNEVATLTESAGGHVVNLVEDAEGQSQSQNREPLKVDVMLIQPGFGNEKDNHYYPKEMLARDAKVFEGAKMYATDHRPGEKSVRTEVSVIEKITGFGSDGAPIARVIVFDPDFAEATRNRAKAGLLETLECSILASGRSKRGTVDGKPANIVEAITQAHSVDWVTKAGAGGKALNLAESATGAGETMLIQQTKPTQTVAAVGAQTSAVTETTAPAPEAKTETLSEAQTESAETKTEAAPVFLAEAAVQATLTDRKLPPAVQKRILGGQYADVAALDTAIAAEVAYLKEATQSGKPLLLENKPTEPPKPPTPEDRRRAVRSVLARHR